MAKILVFTLFVACIYNTHGQRRFREELFPEQLQQQEQNQKIQKIQDQLQELNINWQRHPERSEDFIKERANLLQELQNHQVVLQELQTRLQKRLSNIPVGDLNLPLSGTTDTKPTIKSPDRRRPPPDQFLPEEVPFVAQPDFNQQNLDSPQQPPNVGGPPPNGVVFLQPVFITKRPPCTTISGERGRCKPLSQCVTFYADIPELRRQPCPLNEIETGVCCPKKKRQKPPRRNNQPANGVLRAPPPPPVEIPPLSPQQLNNAGQNGLQRLQDRILFIADLFANNIVIPQGTPGAWHQQFFQTTNQTLAEGNVAQKTVEASINLVKDFNLSPDQGRFALPAFSVLNTIIADTCPPRSNCRVTKYRSPDGSCNNLENDRWGKASTALQRILPPKYEDGVNAPRSKAANGQDLPSSRLVSSALATDSNQPHENLTLLVMQWGQFLDHDLTHTPIAKGEGGSGITCCQEGNIISERTRHPDCFPIGISRNDHMFARFQERCMEFTRSLPAPRPECNFGPREQMNQITGFIDGSNIYGSSIDTQRSLREFRGGRLIAQNVRGGKQLLPGNKDECVNEVGQTCFKAGDTRVNEQINLAVMHTLWLREHNRIAQELARLNPQWNDEQLFQETRRIVVAEMQHITYNEFLPIVLGIEYMDKFEMAPKEEGYTRLYDRTVNPSITNVFSTAAYRFGHSLVASLLQGVNRFGNVKENMILHQHHFAPFVLYNEGSFDNFVRGLSTQSSQKLDRHFTSELTDHLFQGDLDFGLDLVSLNIQRGRDHGLPPFNEWREVCGLPKVRTWEELAQVVDPEAVTIFQRLYPSVDELDLFPAAMAENAAPGALLGPTFVCLVGDQFSRLRRGDRYFYEESDQGSSFTPEQLNQLKNTNLARIICDNTDDLAVMQPLAFFKASLVNQRLACNSESILHVDLSPWRGERPGV